MSGIIDKKGKDSVSKNPYYMISLSGAYDSQSFWKAKDIEATDNILNKPGLDCIYTDCTDISGSLYFCSDEAKTELEKRLAHIPVNALHFIDSGDYHYVSLLFLQRINRPFSLLLFDHHSDCMESAFGGGLLTCGSWVLHALENLPNLKKAVLVGPADEDKTAEQLSQILCFLTDAKKSGAIFLGMDVCGEQKVSPEGFHLDEENGANLNSSTNEKIKFYQKDLTFSL